MLICYNWKITARYTKSNVSHTFGTRIWLPNINIPVCVFQDLPVSQALSKLIWQKVTILHAGMFALGSLLLPNVCDYILYITSGNAFACLTNAL
jgi:hypothetical protein